MPEPVVSSEGRTFEVPPKHVREKRGYNWPADRELEINLHERVTGIPREHCRVDPVTRNGEPQFPLGGQRGHDFAPAYLSDDEAMYRLLRWLSAEFPDELRVVIMGRRVDGKYTAIISLRARLDEGRPGFHAECDGRTRPEAFARAVFECLAPHETVPCEPNCPMCRGIACRWCLTGFAGTERTCTHRKRRRHIRNPEKEPVE